MAFLRSMHGGGDEVLRRHIAGQIVELAEKYAPDTAWYIRSMAEVRRGQGALCGGCSGERLWQQGCCIQYAPTMKCHTQCSLVNLIIYHTCVIF